MMSPSLRRLRLSCLFRPRQTRSPTPPAAASRSLHAINQARAHNLPIVAFRAQAFDVNQPLLIPRGAAPPQDLPARDRWFEPVSAPNHAAALTPYLARFASTVLPYELTIASESLHTWAAGQETREAHELAQLITHLIDDDPTTPGRRFHRFHAPLALLLRASRLPAATAVADAQPPMRLYIAQASRAELPPQLQDDLPTPARVRAAGRGDIYDVNLWLGCGGTYTPVHTDPNPNYFVQLAGRKKVRLFAPPLGAALVRAAAVAAHTQQQQSSPGGVGLAGPATAFRLEDVMDGPAGEILDRMTWGPDAPQAGFEATLAPGDALFIPTRWWHSFKSDEPLAGVTASVNWWFR